MANPPNDSGSFFPPWARLPAEAAASSPSPSPATTTSSPAEPKTPVAPTDAFADMSINRQDSLFKIDIADCGKQGVPAQSQQQPFSQDELHQTVEQTTFIVDVKGPETGTFWLTWLKNLGDDSAAYLKTLEFSLPDLDIHVEIQPGSKTPHIECEVLLSETLHVGGKEVEDRDVKIELAKALVNILYGSFKEFRKRKMNLYGGGTLTRKDINKIGWTLFRVPAICHLLMMRYEQTGSFDVVSRDEVERNDESAIEDSGDEIEDIISSPKQRPKGKARQTEDEGQKKKRSPIQQELASREHAATCEVCACAWVKELEGNDALYNFHPIRKGGHIELVFGSGESVEATCGNDCTAASKQQPTNTHRSR